MPEDVDLMSQLDEWLRRAKHCLESAQAAEDSRIRDTWIELAEEWMKLAATVPEAAAMIGSRGTQKSN